MKKNSRAFSSDYEDPRASSNVDVAVGVFYVHATTTSLRRLFLRQYDNVDVILLINALLAIWTRSSRITVVGSLLVKGLVDRTAERPITPKYTFEFYSTDAQL